jgi:hypothetical protein
MSADQIGEWLLRMITDYHCESERIGRKDFIATATLVHAEDCEIMLKTTSGQVIMLTITP